MRQLKSLGLAALLSLAPLALAQTLAELQLVVAISAELNPAISLPRGSYRAVGGDLSAFTSKVPDAGSFTDWEVYAATGLAANLQPAFVQQITTSFAVNGYFLSDESERKVGDETQHRYLFEDDGGKTTLLYTIRRPQELIYLIARGR